MFGELLDDSHVIQTCKSLYQNTQQKHMNINLGLGEKVLSLL